LAEREVLQIFQGWLWTAVKKVQLRRDVHYGMICREERYSLEGAAVPGYA